MNNISGYRNGAELFYTPETLLELRIKQAEVRRKLRDEAEELYQEAVAEVTALELKLMNRRSKSLQIVSEVILTIA